MASGGFTVTLQDGVPPVIVLSGEVNYESAPLLLEAMEKNNHRGSCLAIDCGAVDFIDSSGIGVIAHSAAEARKAGGDLLLRRVTPQLLHALSISGFINRVTIESTTDDKTGAAGYSISSNWRKVKFNLPFKADRDSLIRKRITEMALSMPFSDEQVDDIRLAVGEAVSNAVRHGCKDKEKDRINVECARDSEKLIVSLNYPGEKFCPESIPIPDLENPKEGGMGIYFMKLSMDKVEYNFDGPTTTVTMVKYLDENVGKDGK